MKKYNEIIPSHYKKLFYNWLRTQNILQDYLDTMQTVGKIVPNDNVVYIEELINHSFYWANSQQGHNFWKKVSTAWRKYISGYLKTHPFYSEEARRILHNSF